MNDSTLNLILDLFCNQEAESFAQYVERLAAEYEVTADYILEEFILDKIPDSF